MSELRNKLIRLAHEKPHLREHLLPLVKQERQEKQAAYDEDDPVVQGIMTALNRVLKKVQDGGMDRAEYNPQWGGISGTYRTWKLPKYPGDMDEYEYEELAEKETKKTEALLKRALNPYSKHIQEFYAYPGDKNWVEVHIRLK